jgi:hypothetical protein
MTELTEAQKTQLILGIYFRTQAAIEKFMGPERLPEWTEHMAAMTAEATRHRFPEPRDRARSVVGNLSAVLDVYGSDQTLSEKDGKADLDVRRCGIYDYREQAARSGVELTLDRPCDFCVDLRYRTAAHLGVEVTHELRDRGCRWSCSLD